jgi:CHAT domain-containing protein/tetratricopeptide (TPR) repeat protein
MTGRRTLQVVACCLAASVCPRPGPALADEPTPLAPGQVLGREMAAGETHRYAVELRAGEYLQVRVEQRNVDVVQTLTAPDGAVVIETDSPSGINGPDPLAVIASQAGVHVLSLKVEAGSIPPHGRYEVHVEAVRDPSDADLRRVKAVQANADAAHVGPRNPRVALDLNRAALEAWNAAGDRRMQMWTGLMVGVIQADGFDEHAGALDHYRRSLDTALDLGDEWGEARVRYNFAQSLRKLGELDEARLHYERALALHRAAGRADSAARVLAAIASSLGLAGDLQQALDILYEALRTFEAAGNKRHEAATHGGLGTTYLRLGDPELALEQFRLALPFFEREPAWRARWTAGIGAALFQIGDFTRAREALTEALALYKTLGNKIYEADSYLSLGDLHQAEGDYRAAGDVFAAALAVYRARSYPLGEGSTQCRLGEVHRRLGEVDAARAAFEAARAVAPRASASVMACAEAGLARVARDAGDLDAARAHAETALARAESFRANVVSPHTRAAALASQQSVYEVLIDTLMRQHARAPSAARDVEAFEVSERARARSLLELLGEGQVDVREGVDPALLSEEKSLRRGLNTRAQEQSDALVAGHAERADALGREVDSLRARLVQVEARIRRASPQYAALTQPQPLTLAGIRAQVLDAETQLLQFALGDDRSYLWVVSPARLESFVLAPRAEIERAASHLHGLVSAPAAGTGGPGEPAAHQAALRELSRLLLGPAVGALNGKRLLVVAPGSLQYVPFASLPSPEGEPDSLVSRFELVSAPSASVIATLRAESRERGRATKTVAVFADPVFEASDPRVAATSRARPGGAPVQVASREGGPAGTLDRALRSLRAAGGGPLGRLPFSRQEGEAILALTPPRQALKATGFEATRAAATSPQLADYRIVHFATHGVLNARRPELSGVVFSLFDARGGKQDGFLRLHDVYNLRLDADLVVLSGCQTALGKDLKGEGLVGLTRGFMYAGARSVVASLWQVDDESTAELMALFYRAMLKDGRRPPDALRTAQLEMSRSRRWSAPFYWAGFVLQGEWR